MTWLFTFLKDLVIATDFCLKIFSEIYSGILDVSIKTATRKFQAQISANFDQTRFSSKRSDQLTACLI